MMRQKNLTINKVKLLKKLLYVFRTVMAYFLKMLQEETGYGISSIENNRKGVRLPGTRRGQVQLRAELRLCQGSGEGCHSAFG